MADAKKCDRCNEYYDDYDGVAFSEEQTRQKYDRMHLIRATDRGVYKKFDLCPDCMNKLISFIKQGEKKC